MPRVLHWHHFVAVEYNLCLLLWNYFILVLLIIYICDLDLRDFRVGKIEKMVWLKVMLLPIWGFFETSQKLQL